jgi:hypothetical protein
VPMQNIELQSRHAGDCALDCVDAEVVPSRVCKQLLLISHAQSMHVHQHNVRARVMHHDLQWGRTYH